MSLAPTPLIVRLALVLLAVFGVGLAIGPGILGLPGDGDAQRLILWEIRLPRAILAASVGAVLAASGAALQGYLRNPLAEPGIIGVSGGAALGAVIAIHLGLAGNGALALPLAGLAGAAVSTLLVVLLAGEGTGPVPLLLAGVAMASLAGALISLILNLSGNPFAATESIFWMMGSFVDRSWRHVWFALPLMAVGLFLLLRLAQALDALTLGEETAATLGVDLVTSRRLLVAGVALGVGAATAVSGIIGFVGLVVPHLLRPFVGHQPGRLLPASALGGAVFVLVADTVLRLLSPWLDVRIGVLAAVLGAPFFMSLVVRLRREFAP